MESKRIKIQDGILDVALRVIFILNNCNTLMNRDRLVAYCYLSTAGTSNEVKSNASYIGYEKTIGDSLHFLLAKQLLSFSLESNNNLYGLTSIGKALVVELTKEPYASVLIKEVEFANDILSNVNDTELSAYIKTQI